MHRSFPRKIFGKRAKIEFEPVLSKNEVQDSTLIRNTEDLKGEEACAAGCKNFLRSRE